VAKEGQYQLEAALTMARDYATVQLSLDGKPLGDPIDLYNYPHVVTTGVLDLGQHRLAAGTHQLGVKIVGANRAATAGYRVGIDYERLIAR